MSSNDYLFNQSEEAINLPEDHWIYSITDIRSDPLLSTDKDLQVWEKVETAVKFSLKEATYNGKDMVFNPDTFLSYMKSRLLPDGVSSNRISGVSNLHCCTFTGADNEVNFSDLGEISRLYPFVEFGILWSEERSGTSRYPTLDWIKGLVEYKKAYAPEMNLSLHVCGHSNVDLILNGTGPLSGKLLREGFERVQLNFRYSRHPMDLIVQFIETMHRLGIIVITQDNNANRILGRLFSSFENHQVLADKSGGNGILPEDWPEADYGSYGYAGGLTPENILEQLEKIIPKTHFSAFWVDMETGVRDSQGHFSLDKCKRVLELIHQYRE